MVFDIPGAGVFREELLSLVASGSLSQHRFQFGNELYEKPGIFEADLHSEHVLAVVPHFHELFLSDSLVQELDRHLPDQEKPRYQLFGVAALAHRGLPPCRGFVREVPLAFPAPHLHAFGLWASLRYLVQVDR